RNTTYACCIDTTVSKKIVVETKNPAMPGWPNQGTCSPRARNLRRWRRAVSQNASDSSTKNIWPIASASTECDRIGATTRATTAPSRVEWKDLHDATVPRMCGNRSSASRVAPGAISELPKVKKNIGATVHGSDGGRKA